MTVFRDLSQHILDIAENGVKAGATLLHINITEDFNADLLSIAIQDNGCGMDSHTLEQVLDPWFTTRTTRNVGLGIPFFKQSAEMCGGSFLIQSQVKHGTLTQATFQHSHIDRPPLGALIETLLCMIVGFSSVDVVYEHRVNAQTFIFDTREIRAILGDDVPLSDPEVLAFMRESLEQGIYGLEGELLS